MTLATVTPLRSSKTPRQAKSRATVKRYRRQSMTATAVGLLACTLTGLSLAHLAEGITIVTNCPASGTDSAGEGRIGNDPPTPDRGEQIILARNPVAVSDQVFEHFEYLRFDRYQYRSSA